MSRYSRHPSSSPKSRSSSHQVREPVRLTESRNLYDLDSETPRAMDHTHILCPHHCGVDDSRLRIWYDHAAKEVSTVGTSVYDFHSRGRCHLHIAISSFAIAASMFMNSNSLPIALMQSLVVTVPGLKWEEDDNKDAMVGRALTYLVLYSTLGMVVRALSR